MMPYARDTGFHHLDPDYTRGRGSELAVAEAIARREEAMARHLVRLMTEEEIAAERAALTQEKPHV